LEGAVTGNPLGMASAMTFTGNGELDNGSTFTLTIAHTNKSAYTASGIALTTPTFGTFKYDEGGGSGIDRIDDMMPTAWEEVDGTGLGMGLQTAAGVGAVSDIEWDIGMGLPEGLNAYIAYSPQADGTEPSNKGTGGSTHVVEGDGYDVVLTYTGYEGLNIFGGISKIDQIAGIGDRDTKVYGATYAIGGATVGYQHTKIDNPGIASDYYENDAYAISFAVNDALTVSYGRHESDQHDNSASETIGMDGQSLQASYTVGGASVKIAETSVDNQLYSSGTNRDGRTIALTLAF